MKTRTQRRNAVCGILLALLLLTLTAGTVLTGLTHAEECPGEGCETCVSIRALRESTGGALLPPAVLAFCSLFSILLLQKPLREGTVVAADPVSLKVKLSD